MFSSSWGGLCKRDTDAFVVVLDARPGGFTLDGIRRLLSAQCQRQLTSP
jgi:hypothetical protein